VRFISNDSSGKMGKALAEIVLGGGHNLVFITGQALVLPSVDLKNRNSFKIVPIVSADDMFKAVKKYLKSADIVISAAAVSDFKPVLKSKEKIKKKSQNLTLKLVKNPDIISYCGKNKGGRIIVGFALETQNLLKNALKKLKEKELDLIVANQKDALGCDKTTAYIIRKDGSIITLKNADKKKIAGKIINETISIFRNSKTCKKKS
jgi:phosphopantothenoylcysteine synthetase/decarboxylase